MPLLRRLAGRLPAPLRARLRRLHRRDLATFDDLRACYRLILGRAPDPEGWQHFSRLVRAGGISVQSLAQAFLSSLEFRRRLESRTEAPATLVALDGFEIYVPADDPDIGDVLRREGRYEPHVGAALRRLLRPAAPSSTSARTSATSAFAPPSSSARAAGSSRSSRARRTAR